MDTNSHSPVTAVPQNHTTTPQIFLKGILVLTVSRVKLIV